MKAIIFNNPPKDLFFQLKKIGLVDFYEIKDINSHSLKGKGLNSQIAGISEKASFGIYSDAQISNEENIKKNYDIKNEFWKTATIDLSDKGIEMLKQSGIKGWISEEML